MTQRETERLSITLAREHVENGHGGKYSHYCYRCQYFDAQREHHAWRWLAITKRRIWLYRSWPHWTRLVGVGDDEYLRRTVWLGPLVIALWRCRCPDCRTEFAHLNAAADADKGQEDRDKQPGRWSHE